MKISFSGGAQTVTGSMYLLYTNRHYLLLECGLYQGKRDETYQRNRKFTFDLHRLDAVVLSHAHIDHSGNLPNLVKSGFHGPIYATPATRDLCASLLPDSGRIHEQDVLYVNKKRARQGLPPMEPLYTEEDAMQTLHYFRSVPYGQPFEVFRGVQVTFFDAGHILGSAMVLVEARERGRTLRLLFSGDLGRRGLPIVRDPAPMPEADVLIIESTYGNRIHPPIQETAEQLAEIINRVIGRGGRIVIPAFAVGRTQDLIYDLHQLALTHRIPEVPIYIDSPLARDATQVYQLHPDCYDRETWDLIKALDDHNPFGEGLFHYVRDVEASKALNEDPRPMIIISASGMAEAGRVQHHLKHTIPDPKNAVIITGWQAPNTLGRRLAERQPYVRIFGEEFPLNAEVYELYGYSAHADRQELLAWTEPQAGRVDQVFVVHGEPESAQSLAEALQDQGYRHVSVPERDTKLSL